MIYSGHIKNGVAVLDGGGTLPEGTPVVIEPTPIQSLEEVLKDVTGKGQNLPADGSVQYDHYIYGVPKR